MAPCGWWRRRGGAGGAVCSRPPARPASPSLLVDCSGRSLNFGCQNSVNVASIREVKKVMYSFNNTRTAQWLKPPCCTLESRVRVSFWPSKGNLFSFFLFDLTCGTGSIPLLFIRLPGEIS